MGRLVASLGQTKLKLIVMNWMVVAGVRVLACGSLIEDAVTAFRDLFSSSSLLLFLFVCYQRSLRSRLSREEKQPTVIKKQNSCQHGEMGNGRNEKQK